MHRYGGLDTFGLTHSHRASVRGVGVVAICGRVTDFGGDTGRFQALRMLEGK